MKTNLFALDLERNITIRKFTPQDAPAVSALVRYTMQVSNSGDYPLARLLPLIDYFSPEKVFQLSRERIWLVAEIDGKIVGSAALEGSELCTFFVDPAYQRQGIGARLLQTLERLAAERGVPALMVDASLTGVEFYTKMGYRRTGQDKEGAAGKQIGLEKQIIASGYPVRKSDE
jgi:GNAT superfamily N-acetyltransferase